MADPGPEHDPYTIGPGDPPADTTSRQRPPTGERTRRTDSQEPPQFDDATLRRVRRLILLSALASITAVFLPPLGLGLGIFVGVLAWRWWSDLVTPGLTRATVIVVVFGAAFAVVVGTAGTTLAIVFASEISDYAACQTGANTHRAQDRCWGEFTDAIEDRLTG